MLPLVFPDNIGHRVKRPPHRAPGLAAPSQSAFFADCNSLRCTQNTRLGHAPRQVMCSVNQFDFPCVEEALCATIIVAGRSAPPAPVQTVALHQSLIAL